MSGDVPQPAQASEASCPVAKYVDSTSEFGQILDFIQSIISNDSLRQEFDIPHLVVVGRQNMAKTTVINRLIGRYLLPMRRSETASHLDALTTYPTILNLRRNKDETSVDIKVQGIPTVGGKVIDPSDDEIEKFLRDVATQLPKEQATPISKTPVSVTLSGPGLSTLTLVDLPGVHFANDNWQMNHVTQELVLDYIKKNKKSIIVIVTEVGDLTGDAAINLVMRNADGYRGRTICVLTKPDKLRETDDRGRRVVTNKSDFTLEEKRFIVLRGKDSTDPREKDWDAETTRLHERAWFANHKQYADIMRLCGIDNLMETMIKLLCDKMIVEVPKLVEQMKKRKEEVEKELADLSDIAVPETNEGKAGLLMKLQMKLVEQLKTLLFNNNTNAEGGEQVRLLFLQFHKDILKVNPLIGRSDTEIKNLRQKIEGVAAPLGDSSENNQLLQRLLYEEFHQHKPLPHGSEAYGAATSGYPLPSPVGSLISICEDLVKKVEKKLNSIVKTAVRQCLESFPDLLKAVEVQVISKIFMEKQQDTMKFIEQFIEMQKKSVDVLAITVPLPYQINGAIATLVAQHNAEIKGTKINNELTNVLSTGLKPTTVLSHPFGSPTDRISAVHKEPELFTQIKHLSTRLHSDELVQHVESCKIKGASHDEEQLIKNTKRNVVRCFNVLKLNVCDTVPRCIQHFFVTELVESLEKALQAENLNEFLQEKSDVIEKRECLTRTKKALDDALPETDKVSKMLLRIKQGRPAAPASPARPSP